MSTSLLLLCVLHGLAVSTTQQLPAPEQDLPQTHPHFTGCFSRDMETFRCRWNAGTFQNLTGPGDLRVFYINKKSKNTNSTKWSECPHYSTDRLDECFFSKNYTSVWTSYNVQLRSHDQEVLYDELIFHVDDIVHPDPPVALNWTLLNVSVTGTHFDVMVNWEPPHSADVQMGWITLQYEVQYRQVNSTLWRTVDLEKGMQRSLYGLQTNVGHEVRVRCTMLGFRNFGEFSDSIFIHIPSKESRFPVAVLLVFVVFCLAVILMLVIVSQQQKLMFIILPPIPGPKIKGIDPELLKKGKLAELTSILGGHPDLRPELYSDDPWVEFIELDIEEPNDILTGMDTECLMDQSPSSNCSPLTIGFRDDDSGRASCCDPDLPDPDASAFNPLLSNACPSLVEERPGPAGSEPSSPVLQSPTTTGESPWAVPGRMDLYAQVSEVRPTGEVMLSPEERRQVEVEKTLGKDRGVYPEREEEKVKKRMEFQPLVMNADGGGYTSELDAGKMSARLSTSGSNEPSPKEDLSFVQGVPFGDYQSPYFVVGAEMSPNSPLPPISPLPPAPVYTMVECVDRQNSLLLTPNNRPPVHQLVLTKPMPTPEGYLTPELMGNITP